MRLPRRPPAGEPTDRGDMVMALLVTLVAVTLSAALVPIVVDQIVSTRVINERTLALDAAQAGIDVALGQLRSAVEVDKTTHETKGSLESLPPCQMTGSVGPSNSHYRVTITYYAVDGNGVPLLLDCPPLDVPLTARLSATGGGPLAGTALTYGSAGTRTIDATYTFKTTNANVTGGAIQLAEPTADPLCMDAGADASPAAGARVTMQNCKSGGSSDQRFAYTTDLNIKLVGSETATVPSGMCLDVPLPHNAGDFVSFQPCQNRTAPQQWSLDDNSNFRGTSNGIDIENLCLNLATPGAVGSSLVLGGCGAPANQGVFRPQTGVGAGMASADTHQLVNFQQFSRCLDVTNFNVNYSYMIVWFCKQSPNGIPPWNQAWALPPVTTTAANAMAERIRVSAGSCLRTPGSVAANQYVTMTPCDAAGPLIDDSLKWTMYGDTGNYATSYRIVDNTGLCLTPTDLRVPNPDTHSDGTAKVKVAGCNNSELQKWNAPADFNKPLVLTNTTEK